jgi:sterol 14-demethylase
LRGLPLLGNLLEFRRNHVGVFERGYRKHGRIFAVRLGPQRGVVLVGPKYHRFFFDEVDRKLSVPELYRFVVPMFGEVLLAAPDPERRRRHVALMQSAFKGRRLQRYADVMAAETRTWLDGLGERGSFDVWQAFEALSLKIAATTLMGPEIRAQIDAFRPLLEDLARGMEFVLPPNLPLPRFRRRDRARAALTEMIRPILAARRQTPGASDDFLQTLVDDPSLAGDSEDALTGMALCTIFTAYITTASQLSWSLVLLLQSEPYLATVLREIEEQRQAAGYEFPSRTRLPRLEWAVKEAIRLRPVMSHYARTNAEEYELDGYRMPKGWLTILCPAVAHRLEDVFTDSDRYDPERFAPERAEDRQPNALIGFGGGFYRCPGSAFGTKEIEIALALLLERYSLTPPRVAPEPAFDLGVIRPRSPCVVRYAARGMSNDGEAVGGRSS